MSLYCVYCLLDEGMDISVNLFQFINLTSHSNPTPHGHCYSPYPNLPQVENKV